MSQSDPKKKAEIIDLTRETTIIIDDSIVECGESDNDNDVGGGGDDDDEVLLHLPSSSSPSLISQSSSSLCPESPIIARTPSPQHSSCPPFPTPPSPCPQSSPLTLSSSPSPPPTKKPATQSKTSRQEAKLLRQKQKEAERLESEANRANAANKALENCTAKISNSIPILINDPEESSIKTLFDESLVKYQTIERKGDIISWTYKRTEVIDGNLKPIYKEAPWIILIMPGSEYLKKLIAYKQEPNSSDSIKTYLEKLRDDHRTDVILIVYNLANHLKAERTKEAKNYRKTFKDRFEGKEDAAATQDETDSVTKIGLTELQDLRLMLEMKFKREHPNWHLHIDFYEKTVDIVQAIVRYSLSIARLEVKARNRSSTGLDWAINMDKEKAVDPTRSGEELTKLWITQLQQFSQVTLPIAKAIASEYPSPYALLTQYQELSQSEAENLLAELHVQKNLRRQIGSNISKRVHCLLTCKDPDVHVGLN